MKATLPLIAFKAVPLGPLSYCPVEFLAGMSRTIGHIFFVTQPPQSAESCQAWWEDDVRYNDHNSGHVDNNEATALLADSSYDVTADLEALRLLEAEAQSLEARISVTKQSVAQNVNEHRDKLCLRHLVEECDGVMSAIKAIAQRLCAKIGIHLGPKLQSTIGYEKMKRPNAQHTLTLNEDPLIPHLEQGGINAMRVLPQAMTMPLILTKNGSTEDLRPIDLIVSHNPIVQALQIIAGILSLSTLIAIIRRKCMSERKRAERAADLEERRNARAYRRAARRALMRRRWNDFVLTVNCFKSAPDDRNGDYEEKRALILQDAFLEQELDQAEKGEIMEAEIRELRCAHEIVASLVRADHNRYELSTHVHDPPPSLIPLPYASSSRSRAASTYTLPSYTSEELPDYSSGISSASGDVTTGPTSIGSAEAARSCPGLGSSNGSHLTRYTPNSSVIETSTRHSGETLRTRQSGETQAL